MARPKSDDPWSFDETEILGGKGVIFTTKNSGGNYYLRMKVPSEGKYLKKSLRTRDKVTAISLAEELVVKTMADVKSGKKVFGITLGELVGKYLNDRREDIYIPTADIEVARTQITKGRWLTLKTHLNNFLKFKDSKLKLSELDQHSCFEYYRWRKSVSPSVTISTVRNEQATINSMMKWAFPKYNHRFERFSFREITTKGGNRDERRRDTFTLDEYRTVVRVMRGWIKDGEKIDAMTVFNRQMFQLCFLIGANTMLRVGELWKLRWSDIGGIKKTQSEKGHDLYLVEIKVRAENSKVRRSRKLIGRGGEYLRRLKNVSQYTGKDDFLFHTYNNSRQLSKFSFYRMWGEVMRASGLGNFAERKLTWYSLRHFGITQRLRAEVEISALANMVGTSVAQIERHYGHIDNNMKERVMLKDALYIPKYDDIEY
jgi:integrase